MKAFEHAAFTADPKPMDYEGLPVTKEERATADKIYCRMDELEEIDLSIGMIQERAYSSPIWYTPEITKTAKK